MKPAYDVTHKGMRVPWITRWTDEVKKDDAISVAMETDTGNLRLYFSDEQEWRDEYDVLWLREGVNRGGVPQWSQVSVARHRTAMRKGLCQVCGRRITARPIHWLMPTISLETHPQTEQTITTSAPTCEECIPVALSLCPHLKTSDWKLLHVLDWRVWGVHGEAVAWSDGPHSELRRVPGVRFGYGFQYESMTAGSIMAKQQIVELTKYVEAKL